MNKKNSTLKTCAASAAIAALIVTAPGMNVLAGEFSAKSAPTHGAPAGLVVLPAVNAGGLGVGSIETPKLGALSGVPALQKTASPSAMTPSATAIGASASAVNPSAVNPSAANPTAVQAAAPLTTAAQPVAELIRSAGASGTQAQREQAQEQTGRIVFDGAAKASINKDSGSSVAGVESRSGSGLAKSGGRRIVSRVAGMAVLITPTMAAASDGSVSSSNGVMPWVVAIGAALAGGTIALIVSVVRGVARTLDVQPSELEIARYRRAQKILELDKHAQGTFDGDRLPSPGMREVFEKEIERVSGKDAKLAVTEAHAVNAAFNKQYAAFTHPILAAIVRSFRKPGDGPNTGVPADVKAEHSALVAREKSLNRAIALAGIGAKDAPLPAEEHMRMAGELVQASERRRAIEAEHPILAKSSTGMKVVGAATGAGLGTMLAYALALVSPTAAVIAAIVAALGGVVALNVWLFNRASPDERAKMGEMFRNMSQTK